MKTLKKIDVLSVGKIYAVLMALVQLIVGVLLLVAGDTLAPYLGSMGVPAGNAANPAMVLVMGVVGGLVGGFIAGVVGAFLYNLVAKYVGGIKVQLD